jgi:formate-dependent nitrite reductase cytochrome c552 subunit
MKKPLILVFAVIFALLIGNSLSSSMLYAQETEYVGPETCSLCHGDIYNEWSSSLHSQMISPLTKELIQEYGLTESDLEAHGITIGSNFPFTIGGGWKIRFINATADPTDPSKWTVAIWQYTIATGEWEAYHAPPEAPKDWGKSCAQCHVTGFNSATETFWGTTDQLATSVSCESCHGPGGKHIQNPSANPMTIDISAQVCGQCHIRGTFPEYEIGNPESLNYTHGEKPHKHHQQFYDWNKSDHSEELEPFLRDMCLTCKSSDNIFNTNLITLLDVKITVENATNPVTCISCHNPHELELRITRANLTSYPIAWDFGSKADWNSVCMQCHTAGGTPETKVKEKWHHAQAEVFTGSVHYASDVTCVHCHMALDTKTAVAYDLRNHSMTVKSYNTYDYSCGQAIGCHQEQGTTWAEERVEEIQTIVKATLEKVEEAITLAESAIQIANQTAGVSPTVIEEASSLLLQAKSYSSFIEADGSYGFHNPTYALSALNTALDYAAEARAKALGETTTILEAERAALQAQVSSLENQVSTLQEDISRLTTRVEELEAAAATVPYLYGGAGLIVGLLIGAAIFYAVKGRK